MPENPKASEKTKELFRSLVPDDPSVKVRPMFGHLGGYVNGNMFTGIYGDDFIVRLPESDRTQLLAEDGAAPFVPLGRAMKEYVVLPAAWSSQPDRLREWIERSFQWAATFPVKEPKKRAAKKG